MSDSTGIEWTDATWNPIRGCSRVSAGCQNCYAEAVAARFSGPGQPYEGLARRRSNGKPQWTGKIAFIEKHLADPLRWRKPRRIFVNSMSDLFHEGVTDDQLEQIFAVMMLAGQHQFQILTKRPERMRAFLSGGVHESRTPFPEAVGDAIWFAAMELVKTFGTYNDQLEEHSERPVWPLENVWVGVSTENQETADERIPLLLKTPAAVRFLSCEPLLGPIDLSAFLWGADVPCASCPKDADCHCGVMTRQQLECPAIDWVIPGGESGPGARPMDVQWALSIVEQCHSAGVAVFVKQLGAEPGFRLEDEEARGNTTPSFHHFDADAQLYIKRMDDRKGGDMKEWPAELRVREFPRQLLQEASS